MPCIVFGATGCFYFLPPINREPNVSPEITDSYPSDGEDFVIASDVQVAFVIARDADNDDSLTFLWNRSRSGPLGGSLLPVPDTDPDYTFAGSQVMLTPSDVDDGEELRCDVIDHGGLTADPPIRWKVVVVGGET